MWTHYHLLIQASRQPAQHYCQSQSLFLTQGPATGGHTFRSTFRNWIFETQKLERVNFGVIIPLQHNLKKIYTCHCSFLVDSPLKENVLCSVSLFFCSFSQQPSMWSEWVSNARWARSCRAIFNCKPLPPVWRERARWARWPFYILQHD